MKRYNPAEIEPKWQQHWAEDQRYRADDASPKPKYYVTGMFPYPSGAGMHAGHFMEHSIVDAVARFRRSLGHEVLYPMGWDSFGLPAENYAIKTGKTPQETTATNIANFTTQLRRVGASIDWSREINTSDPKYYRWTQWIFTQLFERGLAYQKDSLQWWCPKDKTVLANEQVINGRCWRCEEVVVKKPMKQWFFKITEYADQLLADTPALDWPDKIKQAQTNWIGRSEGAEIRFALDKPAAAMESDAVDITVFSTRPDTLFGATFLVLAPEHPLAQHLARGDAQETVLAYIAEAVKKSEIERTNDTKDKTGVFTGSYAINPATGERIPIWVADYVLGGYGTGAVMAVPAHDERDAAFAEKYELPIVTVIERPDDDPATDQCYHGEGVLVNSGAFDGMRSEDAREQIVAWLEQEGRGHAKVTYKMRDWLISRQRYWGAPIPIIHCPEHGAVPVPAVDLPVVLPAVQDFQPRGDGKSVLAAQEEWVATTCPTCGGPAQRETDTMDGYACSSWYLLRYTDPHNATQAWGPALANHWAPLDMYVGGDHATAHLLYVRFWTHVFRDLGLTGFAEPVRKLVYHGLIQAEDGRKMSKSLGNVVDPLEVIDAGYGADALRTFELFLGPIDENSSWSSRGIAGVYRFLNRLWTLVQEFDDWQQQGGAPGQVDVAQLESIIHATTKKVTSDIYRLSFNTAIAGLMECVNDLYKLKTTGFTEQWQPALKTLIQLVQPFAPHMAAELWQQLGYGDQLDFATWPEWNEAKIVRDTITIVVQVNGKVRAKLTTTPDASEADITARALVDDRVAKYLTGPPKKVIYVKRKLVSIVV
ncbi:MAG: leucine--tRNA ligase [Candidatus Nanosynbacter sp.]|nr:leucine--tRNA ligase [Candidatus Nanosynbacter sp.]